MAKEKRIEQLLSAFYNEDTTPDEENEIMLFFNRDEISEKWRTDRDLFHALYYDPSNIPLPEGLSERLESAIDKHIAETARKSHSKMKGLYISILNAAAVVILCIGLFFAINRPVGKEFIADTYSNPEEAAIAVEQALLFVSTKLNQGLAPLEKVRESVNKTNEILNGI